VLAAAAVLAVGADAAVVDVAALVAAADAVVADRVAAKAVARAARDKVVSVAVAGEKERGAIVMADAATVAASSSRM
jgi:hypothetical protein